MVRNQSSLFILPIISSFIDLRCKGTGLEVFITVFVLFFFDQCHKIIIRMVRWEAILCTDWRFEFITLDIPYISTRVRFSCCKHEIFVL